MVTLLYLILPTTEHRVFQAGKKAIYLMFKEHPGS